MRVPPTYYKSCGPAAIAAIAGVSRHEAAELLYRHARDIGFKTFKSTQMVTMRRVLNDLGYDLTQVETSYSVAAWFRSRAFATQTWLILASHHFMVVHDGITIEDNGKSVRRGAIRLLYRVDPSPSSTGNVATFADRMDAAAYRASQSSALRSGQRQTTGRTTVDTPTARISIVPDYFSIGDIVEFHQDGAPGTDRPLYRVVAVKQVNITVETEEGRRLRINKRGAVHATPERAKQFASQTPDRPPIHPGSVGLVSGVRSSKWNYPEGTYFVALDIPRGARVKVARLGGENDMVWTIQDNSFTPIPMDDQVLPPIG